MPGHLSGKSMSMIIYTGEKWPVAPRVLWLIHVSPFYITQPNPTIFRPNPTHDALARTQPDHPPLHDNTYKGDIFQLNIANSKIQNRPRSYIGYNTNILAQTATLIATAITLVKFTWFSLSNPIQILCQNFDPTQPMDGPISGLIRSRISVN